MISQNSVLKDSSEVDSAVNSLVSLGLFPHHARVKAWDTWKMIDIISKADRRAFVLDVGCNGSPILPMLKRLGFTNLYGCDITLKTRYPTSLMKLYHSFRMKEYKPMIEMLQDKSLNLSIQNLENTNYEDNMFDFITSLSVIEHGVDIDKYFKEMSRITKNGGMLLTSTDYWPDKITNTVRAISKESPDNIFSRPEIEELLKKTEKYNFVLTEPVDFTYKDKVVHWDATGLDYTFIFFALRKS
jgi:SAM-dependent methyltransferase